MLHRTTWGAAPPLWHWRSVRAPVAIHAVVSAKHGMQPNTRQKQNNVLIVTVDPEGSDTWRLDAVADLVKAGAVGVVPTDSSPALVCDLESRDAVQLLYDLKGAAPSKQLSILCRSFSDVSMYTLGFPVSTAPGQPDFFRIARHILPGPYTIILQASKALPKQITNYQSGRKKQRSTVGIRLPADPVCQALLERLERPLLCSTVKLGPDDDDAVFSTDAAVVADVYGPRGLSFIVDVGPRVAEASTVIDLSGESPVLVRQGKGDVSWLEEFGA